MRNILKHTLLAASLSAGALLGASSAGAADYHHGMRGHHAHAMHYRAIGAGPQVRHHGYRAAAYAQPGFEQPASAQQETYAQPAVYAPQPQTYTRTYQVPTTVYRNVTQSYQVPVRSYQTVQQTQYVPVTSYQTVQTAHQVPVTTYQTVYRSHQVAVVHQQAVTTQRQVPVMSYQTVQRTVQVPTTVYQTYTKTCSCQ